LHYFSIFFHGE